ncbi:MULTISPECIES: glycine betaine/L-proline ABC transporter permease ProW [Vibrio]|uniref:Glycine/betaine ABC transporter permease n=2 Tax=Vibrio TaxID=662 RepID=A0A1E5FBX7_VIBSP|nr:MULTISPECIES: glycine betaine/L-proline ABC transporter permease ProW [Vibrio]MDD1827480.1 glycine betaine/L-proline ABC transporter permease ProW [Photobacterium sp. ZSDE20]CAH6832298.1 glycine betaine ABC transporter membrane subunit ProW [Vibrio chagasii]MCG9542940.1 glycine betaine/L-proline ABC transporter permease ProW [Vibrio sp. Isolate33]MDH5953208.1 glycine betaine/L-proline ABC transporter permease ProW [Vibrio crassostreae]NOH74701.1 glycine betaine/L-proline ABC transporter per
MSSEQTNNDPWSQAAPSTQPASDPWGQTTETAPSADWLSSETVEVTPFDPLNPFAEAVLPVDTWVESGLNWLVEHGRPLFQAIRVPIDFILSSFETALVSTPAPFMLIILFLVAWQFSNLKLGVATAVSLTFIGLIGAWSEAMTTLSLVMTSVFFCLLIGLPMGIWLARSNTAAKFVRPILDAMQTTPAFVYLVPIVMLFGIGNVPGVVVTIIFALPPVVRLTILGIQQVPEELIEAGHSFGASKKQMLYRIQLPLALPTIMAGVNQTLMLSLSMVVIASMIAVGGLGQMVLRGIGRLDMGLAAVGGLGIVILAILLDRITQVLGVNAGNTKLRWYRMGPVSLVLNALNRGNKSELQLRKNTNE